MKRLTELQVNKLYAFTKKRYVEWYDVQIELVDHLANGIESQWESNPDMSFEKALTNEFKKFGIFGFQDLVEQKTKALNKYYRKQVWNCFKEFFKLPKIVIILFSTWALNMIIHFLNDKTYLMISIITIIIFFQFYHLIRLKIRIKQRLKRTDKKWLFENSILQTGGIIHFLNIGVWGQVLFKPDRVWNSTSELIVSLCIILYLLTLYISIKTVPEKLKAKVLKEYSEYNLL